jgi:hypothetical protein
MKIFRRLARYALGFVALFGLCFAVPFTERLIGPVSAKLPAKPDGTDFRLAVSWYDRGLNSQRFHSELDFQPDGSVPLPGYDIPTSLGRIILKRLLTSFDSWTACEHCYGPTTSCSLFHRSPYTAPDKMRLTQSTKESDGVITFTIGLIPDEAKHAERSFSPSDIPSLVAEARAFTKGGDIAYIEPTKYESELKKINPVRAETYQGALLLWMGGKVGYAIVPESEGCPAINRVFIGGTENKHIYRLDIP